MHIPIFPETSISFIIGRTGNPEFDSTPKNNVKQYLQNCDRPSRSIDSSRVQVISCHFYDNDSTNDTIRRITSINTCFEENGICVDGNISDYKWNILINLVSNCQKLIGIHFHNTNITESRLHTLFATLRCRTSLTLDKCGLNFELEQQANELFSRFMENHVWSHERWEQNVERERSPYFTGQSNSLLVIQENGDIWEWNPLENEPAPDPDQEVPQNDNQRRLVAARNHFRNNVMPLFEE